MTQRRQPITGIAGASARAIISFLDNEPPEYGFYSYPMDAADFTRCENVLQSYPDLATRFAEMAGANRYWAALVLAWDHIRKSGDMTAAIKAVIEPIEQDDESVAHTTLGGMRSTVRIGGSSGIADAMRKAAQNLRKSPPMKETKEDEAVSDNAYSIAADELRQFVERIEQRESEKKEVSDAIKEIFAEAKARGYDTKILRKVVVRRKRNRDDLAEEDAILELYMSALGM